MKIWKACLLMSGLAAAAPTAAHEVVYDSADVRIVYRPFAYDHHFASWQPRHVVRYTYPAPEHRWSSYAGHHHHQFHHRHRAVRVHHHYHGCGHGHRHHPR